jgi:hypothetical protein
MVTKSCEKVAKFFHCYICDYITCKKSSYNKHITTSKHKTLTLANGIGDEFVAKNQYICNNCNKNYNSRNGLWKHKKICIIEKETDFVNDNHINNSPTDKEVIMLLIKENNEFKNMMMKVLENGTHNTTTHTNSHNKSFNVQLFLNETCKDAMNITDFVNSLQLQLSDLEKVGEVGYIEGISNIIIKNLNAMDVTLRPVHCTDKKRDTMYVKDENKWEKEDNNNTKLHKMVRRVSNKNIDLISEFKELYPDWKKSTSKVSDQFDKIIIESMGGTGYNDFEKEEKIIKKVSKAVFIDKSL